MSSPSKITQKLQEHLIPLENSSSENYIEDIHSLKDDLKEARIIGMGEATHSSKEFNQLRHRFFRFLVEELDYKIFGWEASFGETLEINNYVINGEATAKEALDSVSTPNCKTEEVLKLMEWIREHNKQVSDKEKVKFYGFDMQNDIASFKKLREKMQKVDCDFVEENNQTLEFIEQGKMMFAEINEEKEAELRNFTEELKQRVDKKKENYLKTISEREYELLKQLVVILEQCRKFCLAVNENASSDIDSWTFRDRSMAENISWMMEVEDEENAFVWAHNAHIKKGGKPEDPESKALGYYLDQKYEEYYYAVGFDFGTGAFKYLNMEKNQSEWDGEKSFDKIHENTLAQELIEIEKPFFLDFSSTSGDGLQEWINEEHRIHSVGTYFHLGNIEDHYDILKLSENFDGIIFLPEITASEPLKE
ncbi:MAG: erythromycin esterase related protein [Candidatus Nanosalina sp. J07AB43]|jgi:Erythromycin esterase homolog|nr:MAG: erythromycin esterase related protein [Candidatus Nanosalina sp. J07AB43]